MLVREMALKCRVEVLPEINKSVVAELGRVGGLIKILVMQGREGQRHLSIEQISWLNGVVKMIKEIRAMVVSK
ncbi:hypothetical protein GO013_04920 [Pseudodesulfovibrio sp. JC047]|uniref:hypothetical protein n=1 Tax=Pseudodesulfovibrio sp. JC047 TaxID=2683199 RepID=UPI0013D733AE|nr:hypothetical protein [Pseudodesulfovibrio sp. JC047]NDV18760.1 hypothetical protein [Pseudodesulfovibrio sp. JC047]